MIYLNASVNKSTSDLQTSRTVVCSYRVKKRGLNSHRQYSGRAAALNKTPPLKKIRDIPCSEPRPYIVSAQCVKPHSRAQHVSAVTLTKVLLRLVFYFNERLPSLKSLLTLSLTITTLGTQG